MTLPLKEYDMDRNLAIIEGILFASGDPVRLADMAAAMELPEEIVKSYADALQLSYEEEGRGIRIVKLEDSYQMCTAKEAYDALIKMVSRPRKPELTEVVMETLAIIAYKQPVTRLEVENIRGVSCDHAINKLIEYGLIEEAGRRRTPGRPMTFRTTEEFLRRFQVEGVDSLPIPDVSRLEEIREEVVEETGFVDDLMLSEEEHDTDE